MKVILERSDLLKLLQERYGDDITNDRIEIRTDPLEIQVTGVSVDRALRDATRTQDTAEVDNSAPEPQEEPAPPTEEDEALSMSELMSANIRMTNKPRGGDSASPVPRNLGANESYDPPPVSEAEINPNLRGLMRFANGDDDAET